ncbi:MAG: acetolactate synthase, large subunit, biosynthetic type [Deltaproteobacteria bacterium RBG_19FT_COMBO_52_11]|nr:MAG: acetolactate synthase, large subunit, biosynthetic type [Deltaproteobacteria bacterium RBG_19FT_COMBO_52_11]
MKKNGAEILFESMKMEGVDTIFGFPGGAVLTIYDMLMKYSEEMRHILVRHEQGAVHAADGYSRSSGKVGVCLVTSGPGATNTVTGIATAYMDSVPLVVFTGQVPTMLIGNDAFQEADIVGITRPCTKHNYLVKDVKDLAQTIKQAFHLARTGRPGPILVDLPKDVMADSTEFIYPPKIKMRSYNPTYHGHPGQIKRAVKHMAKAHKPLIYLGGGVILANASKEVTALARKYSIPVTSTLMGLGSFPGNDPLSLGMLGMHGTFHANMAITNCDLLIAIGARFDDRVTGKVESFSPRSLKIHIDIDPTSISKNVPVDIPIVGDAKSVLKSMLKLFEEEPAQDWAEMHSDWLNQIAEWEKMSPLTYKAGPGIKPQFVIRKINEITNEVCGGDVIITTEVGQNQMWTAQFFNFTKPRTLITSGGLGTMGYGFPAALGAQVAFPGKTVIDIAGDGSIQMNIQELATAVQYNLPVKVAILNNHCLGMVRQWQQLFCDQRYSQTVFDVVPDFVKLAEAYGAVGLRATRPEEVEPVIREALSIRRPVVMDFAVDPNECVYPMVPAGAALTEMLLV